MGVAILVGATAATFRATLDPATKRPRAVPVDLATAPGDQFALPVERQTYSTYPDLLNVAARGEWDVTFIPFDEERRKVMDYGSACHFFDFTYLVPAGSAIRDYSEIDRPGIRIAVAEGYVTAAIKRKP